MLIYPWWNSDMGLYSIWHIVIFMILISTYCVHVHVCIFVSYYLTAISVCVGYLNSLIPYICKSVLVIHVSSLWWSLTIWCSICISYSYINIIHTELGKHTHLHSKLLHPPLEVVYWKYLQTLSFFQHKNHFKKFT